MGLKFRLPQLSQNFNMTLEKTRQMGSHRPLPCSLLFAPSGRVSFEDAMKPTATPLKDIRSCVFIFQVTLVEKFEVVLKFL